MKTHYIIICLLTSILLSACEEILEVKPRSEITDQVYWENEGDYEAYLTGIYNNFRTRMNELAFGEDRSESFVQGVLPRFSVYWSQVITPENSRDWTDYYGLIGHTNLLLEKIESFPFSNENHKNRIKAEAMALRAAMYFYIAKIWGDVPLMLEPIIDENVPMLPRSPVTEVFSQINADIDQSISLFPEDGFLSKYRFSKPAVYALKADVKMWSAKVLGGGEQDLNAAIAAIEEVEGAGVSLQENFRDITVKENAEIILSLYFSRDETGTSMYARNAFPMANYSGEADNMDQLPMVNDPGNGQAGYAVSPEIMALFAPFPEDERIPATYITELQDGAPVFTWPNKFRGTAYADDRIAEDDIIVYRLADLLLLKAEAYAALGQLPQALNALNQVRDRAGIPAINASDKNTIEKAILDERGRELFHENKRWWDLVRAHKSGVIDVYQLVPNLSGKNTPLYWPVHIRVLALNPEIEQTEGY